MRRRFIADTWSPQAGHPATAALTGDQAAHLARVLRAQPGQIFDIVANGFLHHPENTALREAAAIIEAADRLKVSERDSLRVLDLLEHPPAPNAKLRAAAAASPAPAA